MYNADGSNYYDPTLGYDPMEFRVNASTAGDQAWPAVASDNPNDDAIIAWEGPDTEAAGTTAIYLRVVDLPIATTNLDIGTGRDGQPEQPERPGQVGATVVFTAAAKGTPTPTVQWQLSLNGGA